MSTLWSHVVCTCVCVLLVLNFKLAPAGGTQERDVLCP